MLEECILAEPKRTKIRILLLVIQPISQIKLWINTQRQSKVTWRRLKCPNNLHLPLSFWLQFNYAIVHISSASLDSIVYDIRSRFYTSIFITANESAFLFASCPHPAPACQRTPASLFIGTSPLKLDLHELGHILQALSHIQACRMVQHPRNQPAQLLTNSPFLPYQRNFLHPAHSRRPFPLYRCPLRNPSPCYVI